jgi:hypothetical protein
VPDRPALICDAVEIPDAWVHLIASDGWVLTAGYPYEGEPADQLRVCNIELPAGSTIAVWAAKIYFRVTLSAKTEFADIARLIEQIMLQLHGIADNQVVEVALEADS